MSQDGMVIQGDTLPLLNYLQGTGRVKRLEVVRILEDCQSLLACAPFIFRLVYLPRECNKLADYFAGQASAKAKLYVDQPLEVATHRAVPPYHLAQKLGFVIENGTLQSVPAFVLTECPAAASEELATLMSQMKHNFGIAQDYLATARSNEGRLTIGYKPSSSDGYGRFYAVGSAAQQLPRRARLLLFGNSHCEIDISGAHYELARRYCAQAGAHVSLLPIHRIRDWLRVVLMPPANQASPGDFEGLIKRWPLVGINSDSPQEALAFLSRQLPYLPGHLPPDLTRFAYELHAASRYVMHHPPPWCPARVCNRSRAAPFRYYETLEQHLTWAAYNFLQSLVGFHSAIWLHDGFWAAPCPTEEHITELHCFLSDRYHLSPQDPPLFRCESLRHKCEALQSELEALPAPLRKRRKLTAGTPGKHPLPPQAVFRWKRTYQADSVQAQQMLEERLAKRARVVSSAKKRRLT